MTNTKLAALIADQNIQLKLPAFTPNPYVVETKRFSTTYRKTLRGPVEDTRLETRTYRCAGQDEAHTLLTSLTPILKEGESIRIRDYNPRDAAEQRLEEIAEAIQQLVVDVFEKEEHILWYDTDEYGATNWSSDIVGAVDEAIAGLFESNDPREMGWVGDDGRP